MHIPGVHPLLFLRQQMSVFSVIYLQVKLHFFLGAFRLNWNGQIGFHLSFREEAIVLFGVLRFLNDCDFVHLFVWNE